MRQLGYLALPPIVIGRMLAVLFLVAVGSIYFVGQSTGLIPPIFAERTVTEEERQALARHNAEVKRLIAARRARAAAVRAADRADFGAQVSPHAPAAVPTAAKPAGEAPIIAVMPGAAAQ